MAIAINEDWQRFVLTQGAVLDGGQLRFDQSPLLPAYGISDLSAFGLIRACGEDARTLLQGQLTNDIQQVTPEHSQLSGLCSPKGRMLANFRIIERADALYLLLPAEQLPMVLQRLRMFVLRARVELSDASAELVRLGLLGDGIADVLPAEAPQAADGVLTVDELTLVRVAGTLPRYLVLAPAAAAQALWHKARAAGAEATNHDTWPLLDIRSGVPVIGEANREAFVPQMANMQLIDGVSFTKGCYTGQEVVARMQYLGKLKRRMYLAHCPPGVGATAGQELYAPDSQSGQGAGRVVDARPSPEGGQELLVVAPIDLAEQGNLRLGDAAGPELTLQPPPYGFAAAEVG